MKTLLENVDAASATAEVLKKRWERGYFINLILKLNWTVAIVLSCLRNQF